MTTQDLLTGLDEQGRLLADAATGADLDVVVPSCPGWPLRDLVRHVGMVHRWATAVVEAAGPVVDDVAFSAATAYPPDDELLDWFRSGHQVLVATLDALPADSHCWTFMSGSPMPQHFWARRQLHETTVHRMDVELAVSRSLTPVDPVIAVDGIDELLTAFIVRRSGRLRSDEPWTMAVLPTDADNAWTVRVTAEPTVTVREALAADVTVSGTATDLYTFLWNRGTAGASVSGAHGRIAAWQQTVQISW